MTLHRQNNTHTHTHTHARAAAPSAEGDGGKREDQKVGKGGVQDNKEGGGGEATLSDHTIWPQNQNNPRGHARRRERRRQGRSKTRISFSKATNGVKKNKKKHGEAESLSLARIYTRIVRKSSSAVYTSVPANGRLFLDLSFQKATGLRNWQRKTSMEPSQGLRRCQSPAWCGWCWPALFRNLQPIPRLR